MARRMLKNQGFQRGHFRIIKLPFDVISKMAPEAFFHPGFQVILKKVENRVEVEPFQGRHGILVIRAGMA